MVTDSGNGRVNGMVSKHSKRKGPPPSRQKYERNHPTISIRVNSILYEELRELREKSGLSMAKVLQIGLGKLSPMVGESFEKGLIHGLSECYEVVCDECQHLIVDFNVERSNTEKPSV